MPEGHNPIKQSMHARLVVHEKHGTLERTQAL
jgi:hypothetical protein